MLKANFSITETGGSGTVQLQSSADTGATWQDVGSSLTLTGGTLTVDDSTNLLIDTSVYIPGQTYQFRLIDTTGSPVSSVIQYAIPSPESLNLSVSLSTDHGTIALDLTVSGGSGSYDIEVKGANLGSAFVYADSISGALTDGSGNIYNINVKAPYLPGNEYTFRIKDASSGLYSNESAVSLPAPQTITGYTAAEAVIGFSSTGGDNWTVLYPFTPSSVQNLDGATITSIDWQIDFASAGSVTYRDNGTDTADHTFTTSHGAGVYALSETFHFSDGGQVLVGRIIKVDASGTILGDIQYNGLTVNSVSGLDIDVTAAIAQSGVSETVHIDAMDSSTYATTSLTIGTHYAGTLPAHTGALATYTSLDPTFWSDIPTQFLSAPFQLGGFSSVTIS